MQQERLIQQSEALSGLNPAQMAAVTHSGGPLLVIAGAGSGKTRTLVHRLAWLIAQGAAPESILLLTFTRKAAQNMLERAARLSSASQGRVMGGTFHATANLLLRQYAAYANLAPHFTIIDRADSEGIINLLKSSLGMAGADQRFPSKRAIMNLLSGAVNKNKSLEALVFDESQHLIDFIDDLNLLSSHYMQFKRDHNLMDYDDLLVGLHRLLAESEAAREALCRRFQHILVDEYQDTNHIQAEIVGLLAGKQRNVMVVGDDAQSIYSFRGADFTNIMRFEERFPGTRVIFLEQNYRSTGAILALGNDIITHAREKFDKRLFTESAEGALPELAVCANEAAEARFVADTMQKLLAEGVAAQDIAVLFRSAFHSFKLELELASRGLVFEKRGGLKLTESAHIKDVLSFFRIVVNPGDTLSWDRLLLQLDKVGPKTARKISTALAESEDGIAALAAYPAASAWKAQASELALCLEAIRQKDRALEEVFDRVMEYYEPIFEKLYFDDFPKRKPDLEQLRALMAGYGSLRAFVDDTALDPPEAESALPLLARDGEQKLVLSTIHSAKGLEWEAVFVMGLAEGRFPGQRVAPGAQWEEERRLFYVAVTRARKRLFLSYPREMLTQERRLAFACMSPFLTELKPTLYQNGQSLQSERDAQPKEHITAGPGALASEITEAAVYDNLPALSSENILAPTDIQPGMRVRSAFFGEGSVRSLPGPGRVEIVFDRHGRKILHLDYARLTLVH